MGSDALTDTRFVGYRRKLIENIRNLGVQDLETLQIFDQVPRHIFLPEGVWPRAYEDAPIPIGYSQTASQPSLQAYYLSLLKPVATEKVLEIGTGSGSLTTFVASIVSPRGHVDTFDVEDKFMIIAKKNIEKAGMSKYVTMHKQDLKVARKMPVSDVDMVIIDLGDPWTVIPQARKMLKGSGFVVAICPTMNQLEKISSAFVANQFSDIDCTEHILRHIEAREGKTRHSYRGIGHTTYIAIARKVFFDKDRIKKRVKKDVK